MPSRSERQRGRYGELGPSWARPSSHCADLNCIAFASGKKRLEVPDLFHLWLTLARLAEFLFSERQRLKRFLPKEGKIPDYLDDARALLTNIDDGPNTAACGEVIHGFVDFRQRPAGGDQGLEIQSSVLVELDHARDFA